MADTAVSIVPWPLIITTGTGGSSRRITSRSCRPSSSLPCSQTSRITSAGRRCRTASVASVLL